MSAPDDDEDFPAAVERVIHSVPRGTCITFGEVAEEAGFPGAARAVGNVCRGASHLPWWRVIRADGTLPLGEEQAWRLRAEGVVVVDGRVRATR